jgi:hypothetical protein
MMTAKNSRLMNISVGMNIWNSLARPTIEYGSEILFNELFKEAEICQHYFGKRLLELKQSTNNAFIRGELGFWRLKSRRCMLALRYYKRIHDMDESRLPKQMMAIQKRYVDDGMNDVIGRNTLWYVSIRNVMNKYDINEADVSRDDWNTICYKKIDLKEREEWLVEMNKEKLHIYRKFKQDVQLEKYLVVGKNRRGMMLLVKLRSGSHFLRIETGRYEIKNKKT